MGLGVLVGLVDDVFVQTVIWCLLDRVVAGFVIWVCWLTCCWFKFRLIGWLTVVLGF